MYTEGRFRGDLVRMNRNRGDMGSKKGDGTNDALRFFSAIFPYEFPHTCQDVDSKWVSRISWTDTRVISFDRNGYGHADDRFYGLE